MNIFFNTLKHYHYHLGGLLPLIRQDHLRGLFGEGREIAV